MSPLFLFVLVSATLTLGASARDVPPYVQYKRGWDQAVAEVNEHLVIDVNGDIRDPNRHYVVIVDALMTIVLSLVHNETIYNDIYLPTLDVTVPEALENPSDVVKKFHAILSDIAVATRTLTTLIETTCSFDNNPDSCNQVIDDEVRGDPERYKYASDLFLATGPVSDEFNELRANEFASAAARYDELAYLITSQSSLENIADHAADVLALLMDV